MNYRIEWLPEASTGMLAQLLRAADKQQMLRAARTAENALRRDPWAAGEARSDNQRILFARPLYFVFHIDDDTRTVFIERVRWAGF